MKLKKFIIFILLIINVVLFLSCENNINIQDPSSVVFSQSTTSYDHIANNAPNKDDSSPDAKQSITVFVTMTGTKYHRDGCRYLNQSKISVSLNELNTNRYSACSVCNPMVLFDDSR